ncbi:3-keto-5-aminohexanoate cleavage protein [Geodermatophilus sp. URMC 63]
MINGIKACLNGARRRDEHPALPITPEELAEAAAAAIAAGAQAVHLHARTSDGEESLLAADIGAAVNAVRRAIPGVPIGVSTGLWITDGDVARRQDRVAEWAALDAAERPDFASVNVSEPGFYDLARVLDETGIGVEAGVWSVADAEALGADVPTGLLRILVEVVGPQAADGVSAADAILDRLDRSGLTAPRLLHGHASTCWPLIAHAGRLGLSTRVGLEDTLTGPDNVLAADNAELVQLARRLWTEASAESR